MEPHGFTAVVLVGTSATPRRSVSLLRQAFEGHSLRIVPRCNLRGFLRRRVKSVMENSIRNAIIKFEQEFLGRGPDEVRALGARDLVVVRLKGVLTPAERQLAKTAEGVEMVKRLRQNLIAQGRDKLCEQVGEITGTKILGLFTDIDVQLGERVFVFTMDRDIQNVTR